MFLKKQKQQSDALFAEVTEATAIFCHLLSDNYINLHFYSSYLTFLFRPMNVSEKVE